MVGGRRREGGGERERLIDFKELDHEIMDASKSKLCKVG